jgi:serine/threonine-protein kinase
MTLRQMVQLLLVYCDRHNQMDALVAALQRERTALFQEQFAPVRSNTPPLASQCPPPYSVLKTPLSQSFFHEKSGLEFIRIPADDFFYGEEKEKMYLPGYWISKTPVTQVQYRSFIVANPDYDVPFYNADLAEPYNWDRQSRNFPQDKPDHPAVFVSWDDALAFCEWAGLRLPTEGEWEKAARGTDGRSYPWGNEWREKHCNSREAGLGGTSQVGYFSPQGDSPYGCVDMCGNVWEWTDSWWDEKQTYRVVRGGSWYPIQISLRASTRSYYHPYFKDDYIGFRPVALVSSDS